LGIIPGPGILLVASRTISGGLPASLGLSPALFLPTLSFYLSQSMVCKLSPPYLTLPLFL
jgi:threonine/homoserine/homoserine lactone efflux protein